MISDINIFDVIERTEFLPPYFAVTQKALQLLNDESVEFRQLSQTIETDQTLVSRLLGLVNSVAYSLPRQITRVEEAISYLGIRETRGIVVAASMRQTFSNGLDRTSWVHSLTCAYLAEALTRQVPKGSISANDAFASGLLHDIGRVFIEKKLPSAHQQINYFVQLGMNSLEAEINVIGFDHAAVGEMVLNRWKIPMIVREAVRRHHTPWSSSGPLAALVGLADQVSHWHETDGAVDGQLLDFVHMSKSTMRGLFDAVQLSIADFESRLSGSDD